jgi:hypothetical protein
MAASERQMGFSFKANQTAPLQNALEELSHYFTGSDSFVQIDSLPLSLSVQDV